jgi:ankyrin repeat protein
VRRLVSKGANVNLKNGDSASAAMVAIYNDRFDVAKTLIELGSDVNDGSLYVAVEMRDATTDQFAFDGSRRRPDYPNQTTALDLVRMLLERGADPNKRFELQFHSTHMPNTDRFDNHTVLPRGRCGRRRSAQGVGRTRRQARPDAADGKGTREKAWRYQCGGASPQSERRPHGDLRGDERRAWSGNDRRPRLHPRRRPAVPRAGKPQAGRSGCDPARGRARNPNAKSFDGTTLLHQAARLGNLEMIRALAKAKVDFAQKNDDGFTALDVAEGKKKEGAQVTSRRSRRWTRPRTRREPG